MKAPLISVLIDTHNHEKYIAQAVASAAEQNFPAEDYEIVVVDDGSTDRTPDIVRKLAARPARGVNVRLLRKANGGQASAFNAALPELRGKIVSFLDGDDWWEQGKLTATTVAFLQNPGAAAVGHAFYEFREDTGEKKLCALEAPESSDLSSVEAAARAARGWDFLRTSAFSVKRSVLEAILPVPEALVFCADAYIVPACMAVGVHVTDQPLMYYRIHDDNLCTFDGAANDARLRRRCEMHELLFEMLEPMLVANGVRRDAARALVCPFFTDAMRFKLNTFGGSRMNALRTEMRAFSFAHPRPSVRDRLAKSVVAAGTMLLPPRTFYRARNWYARQRALRFPEALRRDGQPQAGKRTALQ